MTGTVPWDQPDSDPLGDLQHFIDLFRNQPPARRVRVTQEIYDRLRAEALGLAGPVYLSAVAAIAWGLEVVIDDTVPPSPGYVVDYEP